MDLNTYQECALTTANKELCPRDRLANAAMGLAGEAGETADLIKKHLFHDHPLDREKLKSELGDVLWYVAMLSRVLGMDLEEVATFNVEKLQARYPEGFSSVRSLRREANDG